MMFNQEDPKPSKTKLMIILVALIAWTLAGIGAFIMSILCFGKSGTTAQQAIGLALSFLFGPFYWIYYFAVRNYCK